MKHTSKNHIGLLSLMIELFLKGYFIFRHFYSTQVKNDIVPLLIHEGFFLASDICYFILGIKIVCNANDFFGLYLFAEGFFLIDKVNYINKWHERKHKYTRHSI